ncbi:hypothetical protein P3S67_002216 [Capsicum chacoense]
MEEENLRAFILKNTNSTWIVRQELDVCGLKNTNSAVGLAWLDEQVMGSSLGNSLWQNYKILVVLTADSFICFRKIGI